MIDQTLKDLDLWFIETDEADMERKRLLSKMAVLELCGWIEGEFDDVIRKIAAKFPMEDNWIESFVIERTYGFKYNDHLRKMFAQILGEVFARKVECKMEELYPGDLARLKNDLNNLWASRCCFAHADLGYNIKKMQNFDAPSFTLLKYNNLKPLITNYEKSIYSTLPSI